MRFSRSRNPNRNVRVLVTVLSIIVVLGLFGLTVPDTATGGLLAFARPLWVVRDRISVWAEARFDSFREREELAQENQELRAQLATSRLNAADRNALALENEELKKLLGRNETGDRVLAGVLVRPSATPYDTFIVDAGAREGVVSGNRVFAGEGLVIGVVEGVFRRTSQIRLFSSPGIETEATLVPSSIPVNVLGLGGGNFSIRVPAASEVEVGETALLPGSATNVLGVVAEIETDPSDTNVTLLLRTPVNLSTLRFITIESTE